MRCLENMILSLKCPTCQFPTDGFAFTDPRTKRTWPGYEGTPAMTAEKIKIHRQGNPTIYPPEEKQHFDKNLIIQEIYQQKFLKMPWLFNGQPGEVQMDVPVVNQTISTQPIKSSLGPCACGSETVYPIMCQTCGGVKVTGYRCASCGKERKA